MNPATLLCAIVLLAAVPLRAADPIIINGPEQSTIDLKLPGGGLEPAAGVANVQVFRASRAAPQLTDGKGWTYHHHVDMAFWKGRLYVAWDSCEKDEDVWPSRELYATSADGFTWSPPAELFPQGVSTALRMYFFHAPNGRMLAIAGMRTSQGEVKEAAKGSLVVREIRDDRSLGDVYVLRPPTDLKAPTSPKSFRDSGDAGFVQTCEQLLANKPFLEQSDYGTLLDAGRRMKWHNVSTWPADEPSRSDFARFGKAMAFFHRRDGALVDVMKWGWVLVSHDEGETWLPPVRPKSLVAGMAKVWGQRTADDRYALLYNPSLSERYPLIVVSGDDGISFSDMRVVHGEVPPMRYPGLYKVPGPQYVRGISEWSSDGSWKDRALWVCYSMSKEDIWVSRVPLPLSGTLQGHEGEWNTYSPQWAPVTIEKTADDAIVRLEDRDPCDYAKATRLLPPRSRVELSCDITIDEPAAQPLIVELLAPRAACLIRVAIKSSGRLRIVADCRRRTFEAWLDDHHIDSGGFAQAADVITGVSFTTGERVALKSPADDRPTTPARYRIAGFRVAAH